MKKRIPSVHSKSHEDRAYHPGRSVGPSALARALDPAYTVLNDTGGDYPGSRIPTGERGLIDLAENESPMDFSNYGGSPDYDEATGPMNLTRRNRGVEWEPTEYEQEQSRFKRDTVLDALKDAFGKEQ